MRYFINPQFCLDDGTRKGVNVQFYPDKDLSYFAEERQFKTLGEALDFVATMKPAFGTIKTRVDPLNYCPTNPRCK